jgi:SAM-dependent methyltransferase
MNAEFDRLAREYDALLKDPLRDRFAPSAEFFVARKLDVLLAFARDARLDTRAATWLDVGCGQGQLLRAGRAHFARAIGCDVSAGMMAAIADLDVVLQTDARRLPLPDASVDWVTAVCVFHHVAPEDRATLTSEIRRVLRPGGVFAIVEHNPLNPVVQVIVRRTPIDAHAILLTAVRARRLMRESGFEIAATRYFLYVPQQLYRTVRFVERLLARAPLGGQYVVFGRKRR